MATLGCGCKICKAGLGEIVNELITSGNSPKSVIKYLQDNGLEVSRELLRKHLSAFGIAMPDKNKDEVLICEPVTVDLNKIDFSEYDFELSNPESIVSYLQKLNLKVYLNQLKITLQAQEDVIKGDCPDMPREIMQNLALAYQILDKSSALGIRINQQEAIKIVESMGMTINKCLE
jgi:hypothetical protein